MVKDEDLCVHCGLCAERCPTGAWDMQKSTVRIPYAKDSYQERARPPDEWQPVDSKRRRSKDRHGERNRVGQREWSFDEIHFSHGHTGCGKNYFPSNIQGLPTWYEIRVTGDGYQSRSDRVDIMVAMNAQTYARDLAEVSPGGWLIYDSTWPRNSNCIVKTSPCSVYRCRACATKVSTVRARAF